MLTGCTAKKTTPTANTNTAPASTNSQTQTNSPQTAGTSLDKYSINLKFKAGTDVCGTKNLLPDALMNSIVRVNTVCAQGLQASLRQKTGSSSFDPSLWVTVQLKTDANPDTALTALKQTPGVESAGFNPVPQP